MATTAANVRVGVSGEVSTAPVATALPTDSATALPAAWKQLGYNTEAGVRETIDRQTTEIRAWQNGDVVRTVTTSHSCEYSFDMMETNAETLKAYYGNFAAGKVEIKAGEGVRGPWVIEVLDGANKVRVAIPDGEVIAAGTVTYANGDAVVYPVTIKCYPDASGVKAYKYLAGVA